MKSVLTIAACLVLSNSALAQSDAVKQLNKATDVINEIMQTPDKAIPHDLLDKAVCVGIVPSELKFALGIGGNYGRGVMVCRRHGIGSWGGPSFFTMGGGSIGFQIGGEAKDVVFIVQNPSGARKLLQDKVKLGADASVAAGPLGRTAQGETDAQLHAEILAYSRSRGLFAGISLAGAVMKQDKDDNRRLYGKELTPTQILIENKASVPAEAHRLDAALTKYSPKGGSRF